jgi:hypothetical protein
MKKVVLSFSLALVLIILFTTQAFAGTPPNNVGQQTKPIATQTPGAVADSVHSSQDYAASIDMPVGLHFKEFFEANHLIPGHEH